MFGKKLSLSIFILMLVVTGSSYAAAGVEVSGNLNLSGTGTISFPDGSVQTTAGDCHGRYELNSNTANPNGDGTVTDCRTGLIWLKNAKCTDTSGGITNTNGYLPFDNATLWAAGLGNGLCGLTDGSGVGDWRLPTKTEWMAMVQSARTHGYTNPSLTNAAGTGQGAGDIFNNVQVGFYHSGTSDGQRAWYVDMSNGSVSRNWENLFSYYVWPVRSGQ